MVVLVRTNFGWDYACHPVGPNREQQLLSSTNMAAASTFGHVPFAVHDADGRIVISTGYLKVSEMNDLSLLATDELYRSILLLSDGIAWCVV